MTCTKEEYSIFKKESSVRTKTRHRVGSVPRGKLGSIFLRMPPSWLSNSPYNYGVQTLVAFFTLAKSWIWFWLTRRNLIPENSKKTGKTRTNLCEPNQRSSALDMTQSRLGVGSKLDRRRSWCEDGRIKAVKALFTHSPSTPPIRTSEFFIADLRMLSRFCENGALWWLPLSWPEFLWRLHQNELGCDVGEHIHIFFGAGIALVWWLFDILFY